MTRALDCRSRGTGDSRLLAQLSALSRRSRLRPAALRPSVPTAGHGLLHLHEPRRPAVGRTRAYRTRPVCRLHRRSPGRHPLSPSGAQHHRSCQGAKLAFQALHNIVLLRVELGEYERRPLSLKKMRPLYDRYLTSWNGIKLCWVEGKIAAASAGWTWPRRPSLKSRDRTWTGPVWVPRCPRFARPRLGLAPPGPHRRDPAARGRIAGDLPGRRRRA